jgi:acyl transferase domain-containing protein
MNVKGGYFIADDISAFDAPFFSFSSETASAMDPQMRLQLESVYEATEDGTLGFLQSKAAIC